MSVVICLRQAVAWNPLFGSAGAWLQLATPTSVMLFGVQTIVSQEFVPPPVWSAHNDTPTGPVVSVGHVVAV